jgi:hypothetical protein
MDTLNDELRHARRFLSEVPPPQNESNTCDWVILPLLWGLGYERHEIVSRPDDAVGKVPDYTILPGTESAWYLEAKAWRDELASAQVAQSLEYARSNAKRWVVLTNGREWQLYDGTIAGSIASRLVARAMLSDARAMREFLDALGRQSLQSGSIAGLAAAWRIERALGAQLARKDSEVVKAIATTLRKLGLGTATTDDVVRFLERQKSTAVPKGHPLTEQTPESVPAVEKRKQSKPARPDSTMYVLTLLKAEGGSEVDEIIRALLDSGWYVLSDVTRGRAKLKPGDQICFYQSRKGVVAKATVASAPELGPVPGVKHYYKYRWRFRIAEPRYFFDNPVPITRDLRRRLHAFQGKDPESKNWAWFVVATSIVSKHDFELLTGRGPTESQSEEPS